MAQYPTAYCRTCERELSPEGSMKAAREAKRNHGENRLTFEGTRHSIVILESREDREAVLA